jgi:hypothetical protein
MTFEETVARLLELARENEKTVTAAQVEADPTLSADRATTSAAAHQLAGSTNVFAQSEDDDREWFPYSALVFADLR